MTGVAINDYLAVLAAFGAGFDFTVGAGFMIQTGCSLNQYTGPAQTVSRIPATFSTLTTGLVGHYCLCKGVVT